MCIETGNGCTLTVAVVGAGTNLTLYYRMGSEANSTYNTNQAPMSTRL